MLLDPAGALTTGVCIEAGGTCVCVGIAEGDGPDCDFAGPFVIADARPLTGPDDGYDFEDLGVAPISEKELFSTGRRTVRPGLATRRDPPVWPVEVVCRVDDRWAVLVEPGCPEEGEPTADRAAARSSLGT